ncbi:hypothetical protein PQX77_010262 [Marasmius sp. AFHP31]|nr:hypothetical protein PQX77_010262 [Marasmius sp. AFHP31]
MQNPSQLRRVRRPMPPPQSQPRGPAHVRTPAYSNPPRHRPSHSSSSQGLIPQVQPHSVPPSDTDWSEPYTPGPVTPGSSAAAFGYPQPTAMAVPAAAPRDPQLVIRGYLRDAPTRTTTRAPPPGVTRSQAQAPPRIRARVEASSPKAPVIQNNQRQELYWIDPWREQLPHSNPRYQPYPVPVREEESEYDPDYPYACAKMDARDRKRIQDWAVKVRAGSKRDLYSGGYEHGDDDLIRGCGEGAGAAWDGDSRDGDDDSVGSIGDRSRVRVSNAVRAPTAKVTEIVRRWK